MGKVEGLLLLSLLGHMAVAFEIQPRGRGLLSDLLTGFNSGLVKFESAARQEMFKLRPWAERVEEEIRPAVKSMEQTFMKAMENGFHGGPQMPIERVDDPEQDADQPPLPGLHDMLFREPLNPFSLFGFASRRWWEGEHVCKERKVEKEDTNVTDLSPDQRMARYFDMSFTTCRDGDNFHECSTHINANGVRQTVTMRYECCYGYQRDPMLPDASCSKLDMSSLKETLNQLNAEGFVEMLKSTDVYDILDGNVTVFAPSNEAVAQFRREIQGLNAIGSEKYNVDDGLVSYRKKRQAEELTVTELSEMSHILKGHIVNGFIDSNDLVDEGTIPTVISDQNGAKLRTTVYNIYPKSVVMANCAKLISTNHYTLNGVVHIVDKVIMPATKTIAEVIRSDTQFQILSQVLEKANLTSTLSDEEGQFTLFAITDKAFDKLDKGLKQKILSGNGCSADIIKHHILPNVICSGVVETKARTINLNNKHVILSRKEDGSLTVDDIQIIMKDISTKNGVIHVIDQVIIPETARSAMEAMEEAKMTSWRELFDLAGMNNTLNEMSNVTIFAPSEAALNELPESFMKQLRSDPAKLKDFLMYHVATPKTCHCDFANDKVLDSSVSGKKLRLNVYGSTPLSLLDADQDVFTAQCAKITFTDKEVCGGMIHTINKVLLPPSGNLVHTIKISDKHNDFMQLVSFADMEAELNGQGPFTVLAPTDAAFEGMKQHIKSQIMSDKELAKKVVQHHILPNQLCCAGISRNIWMFDRSSKRTLLNDDIVSVRRSQGGYLYADRAEIVTCDMMADNGVLHSIDRVLLPDGLEPDQEREEASKHTIQSRIQYPFNLFFDKK